MLMTIHITNGQLARFHAYARERQAQVPPPRYILRSTRYQRSSLTRLAPMTSGHMGNMGNNALLLHMGNDDQDVHESLRFGKLSWSAVQQKQQTAKASLMLIIAQSDHDHHKQLPWYFPGWVYKHVTTSDDTLVCAWHSHSWQHVETNVIKVLNEEESSCGDRTALSVLMQDHHGSSFRLVLANIFRGMTASGKALNADLIDECWRVLIETTTTESRWLLLGDLATHNYTNIINRFANHSDPRVRAINNIECIKEEPPLVAVSCNIRLAHYPSPGERQSLVFNITDTSYNTRHPWNLLDEFETHTTRRISDKFHLGNSLESPDGLRNLRGWMSMLGVTEHVHDHMNLTKPSRDSAAHDNVVHKIEKAIQLILDTRAAVGSAQSGILTTEQMKGVNEYLKERFVTHSQRSHRNGNPKRGAFRAFVKQQVGNFALAMHMIEHGVPDSPEDMENRHQYIVEAQAMKAEEPRVMHTRKTRPDLKATATQARREYHSAEQMAHEINNGTVALRHLSPDERSAYRKFQDDTLRVNMHTANDEWGHGSGVLKPPSTRKRANMRHYEEVHKKQKRF